MNEKQFQVFYMMKAKKYQAILEMSENMISIKYNGVEKIWENIFFSGVLLAKQNIKVRRFIFKQLIPGLIFFNANNNKNDQIEIISTEDTTSQI